MRAVAIDDHKRMHRLLARMLERVAPEISLVGTADSVKTGVSIIKETEPDLLFLDIDLGRDEETNKKITGFDLLRLIEPADFQIIFITGFGGYVQRALDFEAAAYLHKPLEKDKLEDALQKAQQRFQRRSELERKLDMALILENGQSKELPSRFVFYDSGVYYPLKVDEILYFYNDDSLVWVVCTGGRRYSRTGNLRTYEKHFADYPQFYRIAQGYLANLKKVVSLSTARLLTFSDSEEVLVTPQSAAEVRRRLGAL